MSSVAVDVCKVGASRASSVAGKVFSLSLEHWSISHGSGGKRRKSAQDREQRERKRSLLSNCDLSSPKGVGSAVFYGSEQGIERSLLLRSRREALFP